MWTFSWVLVGWRPKVSNKTPYLSSVCAWLFKVTVLSCNLNLLPYTSFDWDEIDSGRRDHHLCSFESNRITVDKASTNSPVSTSRSALFSPSIRDNLASMVMGFNLKFPPTKNRRFGDILLGTDGRVYREEVCFGLSRDSDSLHLRSFPVKPD